MYILIFIIMHCIYLILSYMWIVYTKLYISILALTPTESTFSIYVLPNWNRCIWTLYRVLIQRNSFMYDTLFSKSCPIICESQESPRTRKILNSNEIIVFPRKHSSIKHDKQLCKWNPSFLLIILNEPILMGLSK